MHEAALAQAALPAPVVILHLMMRPYSLGHELLLHRRSNPFVEKSNEEFIALDDETQIRAIIEAVDICSMTWEQNAFKPTTWLQQFRYHNAYAKWNRRLIEADMYEAMIQFRNYQSLGKLAFEAELPTANTNGSVRYIGAPEILRLYQFVSKNVPSVDWTGESAWDYPYGLARMQFQCHAEAEGMLEIYNWRQKAHDDYVKKRKAEEAQKVKGENA